ncbi:ferritin family protein [Streptomyces sp. NRRL S-646]|uniref:ferritin family protein n=1 Tax=Streptomyces sp. NRRL S-646 TaxID=1463917 RepID=UPI00068C4ED8|nr:ferritin family protein [Streptomyces sp. NRRL S-646]
MPGEALAHARYTLYADHAAGHRPAPGRLFRGTAQVELYEHFAGEAVLYCLVGTTRANLTRSIAGERYEAEVMYPTFARRADAIRDHQAARLFRHNAACPPPEIAAPVTNPDAWESPPCDEAEPAPIAVGEPDPTGGTAEPEQGSDETGGAVKKTPSRRTRAPSA